MGLNKSTIKRLEKELAKTGIKEPVIFRMYDWYGADPVELFENKAEEERYLQWRIGKEKEKPLDRQCGLMHAKETVQEHLEQFRLEDK